MPEHDRLSREGRTLLLAGRDAGTAGNRKGGEAPARVTRADLGKRHGRRREADGGHVVVVARSDGNGSGGARPWWPPQRHGQAPLVAISDDAERYRLAVIEIPSRYRTGNDDLDRRITDLLDVVEPPDRELVFEMIVSAMRLAAEEVDRGELKMVSAAVKEFRYAFGVFAPYGGIRKCTVFGSARTNIGDPAYTCAHDFAAAIVAHDWMVITGAGPGIMEAAHEGAGADRSFGVNIVLPFESDANPVIADDPKLINFKYFFTRKVMFMKESHAFVMLPGGFGTMDEAFELLTLIQTGKSTPAPIVLLDPPGGTYWKLWKEFVEIELQEGGLISPDDLALVMVTDSIEEAVAEVCRFYVTYHSIRFVGSRLVLRLQREIGDEELASLNQRFGHVLAKGEIERIDATDAERRDNDQLGLHRLAFRFDRRSWAGVRQMIDALNDAG